MKNNILKFFGFICLLELVCIISSCNDDNPQIHQSSIEQLQNNYSLLPEEQISISNDKSILTCYTKPTERYAHGILGDKIEGGGIVIAVDDIFHELELEDNYVFEDIRPRLFDVDNDGDLEFICIRSNVDEGAGIVIYKLFDEQIFEYAQVLEIGISNRWLNIVAINDLDNDGIIEIAWIETPHIGGILKVAKMQAGILEVIDEKSLYSNHAIGQSNLCLSVVTEKDDQKIFFVPNQARDLIVGFTFNGIDLEVVETIEQEVDFKKPLKDQFDFADALQEKEDNCIL